MMFEQQCLIQDGEDNWFICAVKNRDAARKFFEDVYERMGKQDSYEPPAPPPYLIAVSGPDAVLFRDGRRDA